jgi:hypothetical protein
MKLLVITSVDFSMIDQQLIKFSSPEDTGEKMGVYWHNTAAFYRFQEGL